MEDQIPNVAPIAPEGEPMKKKKTKLYIFVSFVMFLAICSVLVFLFRTKTDTTRTRALTTTDSLLNEIIPTPTPMPFYEMTIPYLQNREYKSILGEMEEVSSNASYTSYLASYDSDGLKINGQLTIPKEKEPEGGYPAIIFIHGYIPPTQYQTFVNYASYVDSLAREGFVVFKIDLRGHANSEGEPSGAYYSSDYIIDVLNAKAALSESDVVDKRNIGIWGHSMAGNVAMRALAADPTIPAAVIWAGAVYTYDDWQKYGIQDGSYQPPVNDDARQKRRRELFDTHGEFKGDSNFWRMVPATNYLSDITGAVQLNHAIDDAVVDIGYSRDLAELLKAAGTMHELKEYSSGGHNITGISFNQAMNNTVTFFKKYL